MVSWYVSRKNLKVYSFYPAHQHRIEALNLSITSRRNTPSKFLFIARIQGLSLSQVWNCFKINNNTKLLVEKQDPYAQFKHKFLHSVSACFKR
ncbi:unnamed protein product [Acanthoscelides obtectus]|uniref:Uncharacterized protein n=1 Tax=Acanthoscelides obtectus TaxID=200917 RepID=A0A9P0PH90_ACAOB|nr:unnamed protein product [Acanthoscelides obtectus]CAK1666226.1 hypothetical protein AOBTE_LOCUS25219 [Acanthoscelides obtectus]